MVRLNLTIGDGRMVIRNLTGEQAARLVRELEPGSYTLTAERIPACADRRTRRVDAPFAAAVKRVAEVA